MWDQDQETAIRSPHGGPKLSWGGPPFRPPTGRDRLHLELTPSPGTDQRAEVDRPRALGATRLGQDGERGRVGLADPDGSAFCVLA